MSAGAIFALGTGAGRAAIAVLRLSGPAVPTTLKRFVGAVPEPRRAAFVHFRDPATGETLDQGLALWFPGPGSATGEDYAEFQIHGGRATVAAFLRALAAEPGLRPAEPGEFARRGFLAGKLDLTQAEALADLIDAETESQRRQALRIAGGAFRKAVEEWRARLVDAMASIAADLDFSDEGDVDSDPAAVLAPALTAMIGEMDAALRVAPASERLREGFTVFLLGPPNAGKSTLINALAQREVAIVSATPGTTRDLIEAHLDLGGLPVTFVDTAGLREAGDDIEAIGVARVLERGRTADLLLWLTGDGAPPPRAEFPGVELIEVATKSDLRPGSGTSLQISARTGEGLEALLSLVAARAKERLGDGGSALVIRDRHRSALAEARACLAAAAAPGRPLELVAEDLRRAGTALARIVGAIDVEDVLEAVFSRFCIGK